jgi:hypothetical protein
MHALGHQVHSDSTLLNHLVGNIPIPLENPQAAERNDGNAKILYLHMTVRKVINLIAVFEVKLVTITSLQPAINLRLVRSHQKTFNNIQDVSMPGKSKGIHVFLAVI